MADQKVRGLISAKEKRLVTEIISYHDSIGYQEGSTYFLISAQWWGAWQQYVQDHNPFAVNGPRPGPIDNSALLDIKGELKVSEISESHHFHYLPKEAWDLLFEWYGGGPVIERKCIKQNNILRVELKQLKLQVIWSRQPNNVVTKFFSRSTSINEFLAEMQKTMKFNKEKIRVIDFYQARRTYIILPDRWHRSLEQINIMDSQSVLIEEKEEDGSWPKFEIQQHPKLSAVTPAVVAPVFSIPTIKSYEYVDESALAPIEEFIMCSICHEPFIDPVKFPCSDHFCRGCITTFLTTKSRNACPNCTKPLVLSEATTPEQTTLRLLGKQEVFCPNKTHQDCSFPSGCPWKGPRSSVEEHLSRFCEHHFCIEKGCSWEGKATEFGGHTAVCDFVVVGCVNGCPIKVKRKEMNDHLKISCALEKKKERERQDQERQELERKKRKEEEAKILIIKRKQQERLNNMSDKVIQARPQANQIITLDVGGTIFKTSFQLLCKEPLSLLGSMFSQPQEANVVFLDRDGHIFQHVLTFLRSGEISHIPENQLKLVEAEARFWCLQSMLKVLGCPVDLEDLDR